MGGPGSGRKPGEATQTVISGTEAIAPEGSKLESAPKRPPPKKVPLPKPAKAPAPKKTITFNLNGSALGKEVLDVGAVLPLIIADGIGMKVTRDRFHLLEFCSEQSVDECKRSFAQWVAIDTSIEMTPAQFYFATVGGTVAGAVIAGTLSYFTAAKEHATAELKAKSANGASGPQTESKPVSAPIPATKFESCPVQGCKKPRMPVHIHDIASPEVPNAASGGSPEVSGQSAGNPIASA